MDEDTITCVTDLAAASKYRRMVIDQTLTYFGGLGLGTYIEIIVTPESDPPIARYAAGKTHLVLAISPQAVLDFTMTDTAMSFTASFEDGDVHLLVPLLEVERIYTPSLEAVGCWFPTYAIVPGEPYPFVEEVQGDRKKRPVLKLVKG